MKNLIIYALSLIVMLINFNSCKTDSESTAADKVLELYDALKNEKFDKATAMYVTNKGENISPDDAKFLVTMFEMASENNKKKDGLDKVTIVEEKLKEDGNAADVTYTIHYKNGDTSKETMTLNKFDGKWLIKVTNF